MSFVSELDLESCKGWRDSGQKAKFPSSIRAQCPFCGDWCGFVLEGLHLNSSSRIASGRSTCASCERKPQFVLIYGDIGNALNDNKPCSIFMYPALSKSYKIRTTQDLVPIALWRSMQGTVNAYNSRNYAATMSSGGRTLEGIFKFMVDKRYHKESLAKLIDRVGTEVDLAEPIKKLSDVIRKGRNLGAHFDLDLEPNDLMARQLVELLEYLIEFLYVLPKKIENLEEALLSKDEHVSQSKC